MAIISSLKFASASLVLGSLVSSVAATTYLSPDQDIVLPASASASEPLEWLGANSPYFEGMRSLLDIAIVGT